MNREAQYLARYQTKSGLMDRINRESSDDSDLYKTAGSFINDVKFEVSPAYINYENRNNILDPGGGWEERTNLNPWHNFASCS